MLLLREIVGYISAIYIKKVDNDELGILGAVATNILYIH
jgi:hypothetical protein